MTTFPIAHDEHSAVRNLFACECTQIRQAFPQETILETQQQIVEIFAALEAMNPPVAALQKQNGLIIPDQLPFDRCGSLGPDLVELAATLVSSSLAGDAMRGVLGGAIIHHAGAVRVRRHVPGVTRGTYVPWHQDSLFMGMDKIWLTCWVPLVACGINAPALDFIPVRTAFGFEALRTNDLEGYGMGGISEDNLRARLGDQAVIWSPVFEPGDCMVFSSNCVHRTHPADASAQPRLSLEVRFQAAP